MTTAEKAQAYDEVLNKLRHFIAQGVDPLITRADVQDFFPELAESEGEKVRKELIKHLKEGAEGYEPAGGSSDYQRWLDWLEKQGTPAKLSEEEQNKFAKGVLSSCALSFIDYLDAHKYEGKMCVSNGECEDIENAFHNAMWDRLHRYYCKYIEKQGEQKASYTTLVETGDGGINALVTRALPTDGEQNPTDKVEPKFKVGDWITNGIETVQITGYEIDYGYQVDYKSSLQHRDTDIIEKEYHLWTIQDAKDGDVLADYAGVILFRKIGNEMYADVVDYYCVVHTSGRFEIQERFGYWGEANDEQLHPATKEQRDTLLKAMADAGYTFDFENKKLKKELAQIPQTKDTERRVI